MLEFEPDFERRSSFVDKGQSELKNRKCPNPACSVHGSVGAGNFVSQQVSRKRVIRLMQENGLKARTRKRFTLTTMSDHDQPVAANLLDRQFEAAAPNQGVGA